MRIAFVAYEGSVHTRRWAGFFAGRGHDVHVVTCGTDAATPSHEHYVVHDLGAPPGGKIGYLLRVRRARRTLRRLRPDVVHVHWLTSYGLLALAAGVRPLVATAHGDDLLIAPRNPVYRRLIRAVLRRSVLVTVPSQQMYDVARALSGPACRIEVLQYGVESARLAALGARTRGAQPGGPRRTLVSARPLLRLYRFDVLLQALARRPDRSGWTVHLFGDGPERPELERQASTLGLSDQVVFHGRQPPEVVEEAIALSDLYVSVAESDGASIALLEALALGAVPVLSDIPANRSWVEDGVNGVLVDIDPESVSRGLDRALGLDAPSVRAANAELVAQRGDRARNLAALEAILVDLVQAA